MAWRKRKIPKTLTQEGKSSALYESIQPRRQITSKLGASNTAPGIAIDASGARAKIGFTWQQITPEMVADVQGWLDAPNGKIKLDSNRQAIGTNFVTERPPELRWSELDRP